ncbi:MAG: DUF4386 domain-containing protein [Bacteroidota bacterium]|nr:DUF4386 domain-containing protein [Bacteroidota bacterium]
MEEKNISLKKKARFAGFMFIIFCVPLATWALNYVPSKIFVAHDAVATANNLLANEFIFRTAIISHLASVLSFAVLALVLYCLFNPVNKNLSRFMVASVLVQLAVVIVMEIFNISALMILKGEALMNVDAADKQEASFLLLRMHRYGIAITQLFWGLFFLPFGMLVFRSGFIPNFFGILLIISGIGYVLDGSTFILLQRPDYLMVRPIVRFVMLPGLLTFVWLLIKGARDPKTKQ